ncbi:MAG: hypothetical protein L0312_20555 [Acidobacteria bacterium]|nr:hypothetical protein [Acidobacteriota bacterium]
MRKSSWLVITAASLVVTAFGLRQFSNGQVRAQSSLQWLKSQNVERRTATAEKIAKDRREMIAQLLELAQQNAGSKELRGTKELAIDLLGEFRAVEAVEFLIRDVEFSPPSLRGELSRLGAYPSARALVNIGNQSGEEILAFVHPQVSDKAIKLYAQVIRQVDGAEVGRCRIQKALEGNITSDKRAALEKLLRVFEKNELF